MKFPFSSTSADETRRAGGDFSKSLRAGDVVALEGDLGAGKTEFVRGACAAMGVEPELVTSPTFTIVNEYDGGRLPVCHIDAYRLESETEFYDLGYEEYFSRPGVSFVEWPEKLPTILGDEGVIRIRFEHHGANRRTIRRVDPG